MRMRIELIRLQPLTVIEAPIHGDLLDGRTVAATDAIGLLFRSPSSCSGVLTGILEITSRVRRLPEVAN